MYYASGPLSIPVPSDGRGQTTFSSAERGIPESTPGREEG
jgi:hypothetical protein